MRPVQAGKYRKRLQLQALPAGQAKDPQWNEPTYGDWAPVTDYVGTPMPPMWGSVEPLSGKELVWASEVVADATHLVKVRYYHGLTSRMRFLYVDDVTGATRILNIEYVKDVEERHVEYWCICHEAV